MEEENGDYKVLKEKMVQLRSSFKGPWSNQTPESPSRAPLEERLQGEFNYLLGEIADLRSRLQEEEVKRWEAEDMLTKARAKRADAHLMAEYNYLQEELSRMKHQERLRQETEENLLEGCGDFTEIEKLKDCIIQNVSHELRTPVTIASLAIDAAMKENDVDKLKGYLVKADKALSRQERVIEDIMEAASTDQQELRGEEVHVREMVTSAVEELSQEAREKNIEIRAEIPEVKVWADFTKVRHALKNLLHNAIKFTDKGGTITISAKADGGMVEVSVQDSGIGIPEQFGEVIFDRLYQVDPSETRKFGGTGMGLATAKGLIENHGGRLWFHSGVGCGSTFHFTLPTQDLKKADLKRRFRYPADTGLHTGS